MKHAVSISLGSSKRNHVAETVLCGERVRLERIGTDGDQQAMARLLREMDGKVDAFGFGGADLGLTVNGRYYPLHSVGKLAAGIRTPVVDGGGVRTLYERDLARRLAEMIPGEMAARPKQVLFCVGVARYAMARGFIDQGYAVRFGDLAFGLGIPLFLSNLNHLHILARILLPIMGRVPFEWVYPTGEDQDAIRPKYGSQYAWASIIADDFHYIKQHLPDRLDGKIIVTNTTTPEDVELLRSRGVSHLVTVTPRLEGRSFGTNVLEAALTAIAAKGRPLTQAELAAMVPEEERQPEIMRL